MHSCIKSGYSMFLWWVVPLVFVLTLHSLDTILVNICWLCNVECHWRWTISFSYFRCKRCFQPLEVSFSFTSTLEPVILEVRITLLHYHYLLQSVFSSCLETVTPCSHVVSVMSVNKKIEKYSEGQIQNSVWFSSQQKESITL